MSRSNRLPSVSVLVLFMVGQSSLCHAERASSCSSGKAVFYCETTKHKVVEICDHGKTISYSFGKLGSTPELSLAVPRESASTYQWDGMGQITYRVTVPNGNATYSAFWSAKRDPDESEPISAGIEVQINGAHAATVSCIPGTAEQNLEEIDLPPERPDKSGRQ